MHVFQGCITYSLSWGHSHGRRVSVPVDGTGSGMHAGVALCVRRCMRRRGWELLWMVEGRGAAAGDIR